MDVSFNNSRCQEDKGVCPTDPLLFSCVVTDNTASSIIVKVNGSGAILLTSKNDVQELDGGLPDGFAVQSHNVLKNNVASVNYTLVLSIVSASLLNDSLICVSNLLGIDGVAECAVAGKLNTCKALWVRSCSPT